MCYTSKCSQKNLKGGYLTHLLGFEVTERIEEMEAVLEAENITLAFRNQYVLLTVLFLILWCTYVLYLFRNIKQQNKIMITKVTISALEQPLPTRSVIWPRILKSEKGNPLLYFDVSILKFKTTKLGHKCRSYIVSLCNGLHFLDSFCDLES